MQTMYSTLFKVSCNSKTKGIRIPMSFEWTFDTVDTNATLKQLHNEVGPNRIHVLSKPLRSNAKENI